MVWCGVEWSEMNFVLMKKGWIKKGTDQTNSFNKYFLIKWAGEAIELFSAPSNMIDILRIFATCYEMKYSNRNPFDIYFIWIFSPARRASNAKKKQQQPERTPSLIGFQFWMHTFLLFAVSLTMKLVRFLTKSPSRISETKFNNEHNSYESFFLSAENISHLNKVAWVKNVSLYLSKVFELYVWAKERMK